MLLVFYLGDISLLGFSAATIVWGLLIYFLSWIYNFFFSQYVLNSGIDFNSRKDFEFFNKKKEFYECGFKSTIDLNIQLDIHYALIAVFFIIYDIELVFLLPVFINFFSISFFSFLVYLLFVYIIGLSFYYEWKFSGLDWQL